MPARSTVTARQARLGAELRKLRERAGPSIREASEITGVAQSKISMMEAGRVGVSAERVRHLASQYACDDPALVEALVAMATERGPGWWEEYREAVPTGYLNVAELEHHAAELQTFQGAHIPALLQTEEQMRGVFASSVPLLSEEQREVRVRFRLRRQEVLDKIGYAALIHEAALRIRAADSKVARNQLLHLIEQSEQPQVAIRIVPFEADGFAGISAPVVYANGPVSQLDTALVDTAHGGAYLGAVAQLHRYRVVLRTIEKMALGTVDSRDFIHRLVHQM